MFPLVRRLFHIKSAKIGFGNPNYLFKWLFMSVLIGIGTGVGIILFYELIRWCTDWGLGWLVGYVPPAASGEGSPHVMSFWASARPWILPLVTMLGGGIAGIIVFAIAPEAEGHGTDTTITAFHQGQRIRWFAPLVKLFTSALLIGSGGSAGPEGPAGQIGSGFGSIVARLLRLDSQDQRIAMASGMGAGIGAIFRAPLGGALLGAEILYKEDVETSALVPALIASIISYSIFAAWVGWHPLFDLPVTPGLSSPWQLVYYVLLGALCGGVGILMAQVFHAIEDFFHDIKLPLWLKPAIGGLAVGLIGLEFPQILGMSYGWIQVALLGTGVFSFSLLVLLILPFLKIITTSLSLGSGGPGGLFGPGMVVGGLLGAAVWRLSYALLPGLPPTPAPFILIGMMALFGSISRAPLAMMLMVAEMTGNLSLLAPAMIAVGVAYLVVGQHTMYPSQPRTRADSPAHRAQMSFPLLTTLITQQAMMPLGPSLRADQTLTEATQLIEASRLSGLPVFDSRKHLVGVLTKSDLLQTPVEKIPVLKVGEAMNKDVLTCTPDTTLDDALELMTTNHRSWLPVVDHSQDGEFERVVGVLSVSDIMREYRLMLAQKASETLALEQIHESNEQLNAVKGETTEAQRSHGLLGTNGRTGK
jgi:CIC family chloride channel protein